MADQFVMPDSERLLALAEASTPAMYNECIRPVALVCLHADSRSFQGWKVERCGDLRQLAERYFTRGDSFILDFGEHIVGHLALEITPDRAQDAPVRLKLTFAEVPAEVAEPFDPYDRRKGTLSRSWLQDEVINLDVVPGHFSLPRRYAFRYLKIEIIDTSPEYRIRFTDIACQTITSADMTRVEPLGPGTDATLRQIDAIAIRTLRNCMHTVFEDGPKRDRRLWLGDLRLQALANSVTFANNDLTRRCLLLFGALLGDENRVNADIYEKPTPRRGNCRIMDYSALFGATLLDYVEASGDRDTALELWPVALQQMDLLRYVNSQGLFVDPGGWWIFIDWHKDLHKSTAMHGVLIYAMKQMVELGAMLGREAEVKHLIPHIQRMSAAAKIHFMDDKKQFFTSGPEGQISWASAAWMTLAGVVSGEEAADILRRTIRLPHGPRPAGAYLYHHVVHAMLLCDMRNEAVNLIREYWGEMARLGATTFWEIFDPADQKLSPYHNHLMNSYCHAWSCTPTWFIRKWNLVK